MKLETFQRKLETSKIQSPQGFPALGAFSTMKTKDLIKQLQDRVAEHEAKGMTEVMGEHEIMIDVWQATADANGNKYFIYKGFSPNVEITYSADGVYPIIAAKESWT